MFWLYKYSKFFNGLSNLKIFQDINISHLEQLSRNFEQMFKLREHDCILKIVANDQEYFAHKNIFSCSSLYLK